MMSKIVNQFKCSHIVSQTYSRFLVHKYNKKDLNIKKDRTE